MSVFTDWPLYVELGLTVVCGIIWVLRQTQGLALYDPLIILPLLIGTYILFGGVAGGLFFNEVPALPSIDPGCSPVLSNLRLLAPLPPWLTDAVHG